MKKIVITPEVANELEKMPIEKAKQILSKIDENNLNEKRNKKIIDGENIYKYHIDNRFNVYYASSPTVITVLDIKDRIESNKIMSEKAEKMFKEIYIAQLNELMETKKHKNKLSALIISWMITFTFVFSIIIINSNSIPIILNIGLVISSIISVGILLYYCIKICKKKIA